MSKYSTKQRELLLLYLSEHVDEKISVKQIVEALKKEKISLSAIYRNLAEIEKNGHLKRFAEKKSIYIDNGFYTVKNIKRCKERNNLYFLYGKQPWCA